MCIKNMSNYIENDSQISVCVLAPEMPPVIGGAETFSEVLVLSLIKKRIRVYLITSKRPRDFVVTKIEQNGGKVFLTEDVFQCKDGFVAWEWAFFSRAQLLHDVITTYRIDLVHALSHDTIISASIALCNTKKHIPLVITTSEMSTEDSEFGIARSKFTYNVQIDGLLQLSQYYLDIAYKYGCKPILAKVTSCVDCDMFLNGDGAEARKKYNISDDKFIIVCPSRFSPRKGQKDLIEAISKLPENLKNKIVCFLAGSTNSASKLYYDGIVELSKKVNFEVIIQSVKREEMPNLITAADLCVMPSKKEGLGFAAIECLVAGCPVLLSNTSGFNEISDSGDQVELFELGDNNLLSNKIENLIVDDMRRRTLAENGKKLALTKFSMNNFADQVFLFYHDLLDYQRNY